MKIKHSVPSKMSLFFMNKKLCLPFLNSIAYINITVLVAAKFISYILVYKHTFKLHSCMTYSHKDLLHTENILSKFKTMQTAPLNA